MDWFRQFRFRLSRLLNLPASQEDLADEIQSHIEIEIDENIERGMSPTEARRAARLKFGSIATAREESREAWGFVWLETTFLDLRYAVRSLCQNPGFTAVVVVSLALGIGANTAVFSVVNAILLRPLPYEDPERIVLINSGWYKPPASPADYQAWEEENQVFERMAYWGNADFTVKDGGVAQFVKGQRVAASLFPVLGVQPILGRNFLPDDEKDAAVPTVILSYRLWERLFEKDPNVIGKNLRINLENATVVASCPQASSSPTRKR